MIDTRTKVCSKCKLELELRAFRAGGGRMGLQNYCNDCGRLWKRAWYKRGGDAVSRHISRSVKTIRRKRSLVRTLKDSPCADCRVRYPYYVMDFDHRGSKRFALSQSSCRSDESIRKEAEACDIVCSNCHRERTHRRKQLLPVRDTPVSSENGQASIPDAHDPAPSTLHGQDDPGGQELGGCPD